ncbi:diguanylate cyclase [Thermomonas sp.]|uniref:GGDEF domain-containing response regulator n=1 Tax=Thermomonas sp. TaxID=1971895 RepID=UPI0024894476|nr:diguanylate cyclase [Thermomonas sp.]MDI1251673.1 diguanylate cyclase [Thermomonas sp.]
MGNCDIILCVDDDSTVLSALRTMMATNFGQHLQVEFAESGEEALEIDAELRAQGRELSLVISDFMMPGLRGDELLVRLHERSPNTVKILLTGQSDVSGVKRAINEANLYRFLEKPFLNEDIVLTVRAAIRAYQQERDLIKQNEKLRQMNADLESLVAARTQELVEKNQQLEILSVTDKLTGLFNRRKLDEEMEEELARSRRYAVDLAIIMVDIDHFKRVNDTYGHGAGDIVLAGVADILRSSTRDSDAVGRLGGEEFVVLCRHSTRDGGLAAAENLRAAIEGHAFAGVDPITASFGVASYRDGDTVASLLGRADAALYRAKNSGRNRVEIEID